MNHEQVRHFEKVVSEVGKTLVKNPRASINDLCRACKDAGLQVSKPLVARARKVIVRAVLDRTSGALKNTVDAEGHPAVLIRTHTPPELMAPPTLSPEEKAAKLERERARVVEQKERELEREMQWVKERTEERKAFEATHNAVVSAMQYKPATPGGESNTTPPPTAPLPEPATGKTRSAADVAMRRSFLNALLDADPGAHPQVLMGKLQEQFGTGLSWSYLYETCRVAREVSGLPQLPEREGGEREPGLTRQGLPSFPAAATESEPEVVTLAEDLQWLAQQARDVMRAHGLSDLALVADETGAEWTWTEKPKSGSGKLKF